MSKIEALIEKENRMRFPEKINNQPCPYSGLPIENVLVNNIKYIKWLIINVELFPPEHILYEEGLLEFIEDVTICYNQVNDEVHTLPIKGYLTPAELI